MNYYEKYLKYKTKYDFLKNTTQLGGLNTNLDNPEDDIDETDDMDEGSYLVIISSDKSIYNNFYALVTDSWKTLDILNIAERCSDSDAKTKPYFDVLKLSIPTKDGNVTVNMLIDDITFPIDFKIFPSDYVTVIRDKCDAKKIYNFEKMVANFNNTTGKSEQLARVVEVEDSNNEIGKFKESELRLATAFNYIGQHVSIDTRDYSVSSENRKLWSNKHGYHGVITSIQHKEDNPYTCHVTLDSGCVFALDPHEHLLVNFVAGTLYDYPKCKK